MAAHGRTLLLGVVLAAGLAASARADVSAANAGGDQAVEKLRDFSLEDLANLTVTSVSKRDEPLSEAASSIYVITHDDIARSGATSVPEILRLAPNLQVTQTSASGYVITARGFNGNPGAQSFSNKLLVLIDGRSVYTPLFSGVYWDMQDVLPEDIERIEVISGPGATLWGANAVNGVINIITRSTTQTQGGLVDVGAGDQGRQLGLRYGGKVSENLTWRIYGHAVADDEERTAAGAKADDGWSRVQGGFRMDWAARSGDMLTFQGDAYRGSESQAGAGDEDISGQNLTAHWTHATAAGTELQAEAYYDRAERATEGGGGKFYVDTFNIDVQDSFTLGERNQIVFGGGGRTSRYRIEGTPTLFFIPGSGDLNLADAFAQDTITLSSTLRLTVGLKVEADPYVNAEPLPDVRLAWSPNGALTLWGAVSKAVRSPTPFDRDVVEKITPTAAPQLIGDASFQQEKLTAYEAGARFHPTSVASFSISTFYNDYDQLRTIELSPGPALPLLWGNGLEGTTYGLEAWGEVRVQSWWRMSGGFSTLHEDLRFKPGAIGIVGLQQDGLDPKFQGSLKSSMDLGQRFTLDGDLRYVGALPNDVVPAYVELNSRLGWNITDRLQISVSGRNLLHARHLEYPGGDAIQRAVSADLQWRF
ncbi:TonB-dependent receptor [Phenylobacterium sp.]|uniref:TonB-dependent receptor plug domain-containing protein n=1 Tax=Phenylobacterium sp. TaxID=1871053 RepID=UPI0025DCD2E4|nr:TonB-dependent receptor [Phenylobacterium sp.]